MHKLNLPKINFKESFSRNIETVDLMENFLIASVSSIIITRVFLNLTGYPQIGGAGLHIAHMLWGGLLMLIANTVAIIFLNKEAKHFSVIISGIGFGLFIDELGKFITRDNNYFYQPTFAIIYIIFILLFYLFRSIFNYSQFSDKEYAVNALEEMKEVVYYDLDEDERQKAVQYLDKSDPNNPVVASLKNTLKNISPHTTIKDISLITYIKRYLRNIYIKRIQNDKVTRIIAGGYIFMSIIRFILAMRQIELEWNFWELGRQISSALVFILIVAGLNYQRKGLRQRAYTMYLRAVMISILVVQIFDFYFDQLSAIFFLFIGVMSYTTLQYLLQQEKNSQSLLSRIK
jgi:hypothetical protein